MTHPTHLVSIGLNVKRMREARGMTQSELAESSALRQATIADIELGKSNFEINTLVRICSALNCYLDINISPAG
ncbi:helix-turn-helix transcriptional regulator [Chitinophaga sp. sic0106]|uniref:helix-turn-helix transcriptional regulator n=1 Tax=Chitinophaga sp. sic0106 TaxID=2854785 RepID=UPI001C476EB3|nr:helix-turn-helix transcriptional regulator [Chitinophaga sp. sic0106]